jgi:DUF4097 and DUF4098 domain-containing protein YvlB
MHKNMALLRPAAMISAILAAVLIFNVGCIYAAFQDSTYRYKEDFVKTYPLASDGTFSLQNTNGIVRVTTWSKSEVEIKAVKSASRQDDLEKLEIKIFADPRSVSVDTVYPRRPLLRAKVTYEISVPEGVRLDRVSTTNGNIELTGRYSDVRAGTTNGDVRCDSVSGALRLSTTNGSIKAQDVIGRVKVGTTNGSVTLGLRDIKDSIDADTTNGSITLRIQGDLNADLSARTTNGRVNTEFPITVQGSLGGSRHRVEGRIGSGGPEISLHTTNGSIHITK